MRSSTVGRIKICDGEQSSEGERKTNMVEVIEIEFILGRRQVYDSNHFTANQHDLDSSKIETFVENGHKFNDLALQLQRV